MMKHLIFCLLVLQSSILFGQISSSSEVKDSSNVYNIAFGIYLERAGLAGQVFLEQNTLTTKYISVQFDSTRVQVLDYKDIRKKSKKGPFTLYSIIPLRFEEGVFFINIIPFTVSYKRKGLNMTNLGGMKIKFKYRCDSNLLQVVQ